MASKKPQVTAGNSGKPRLKGKPRGKPNPQNLTPWPPGVSGNPAGRPPDLLSVAYRGWLKRKPRAAAIKALGLALGDDIPVTNAEAAAEAIGMAGISGDVGAAKEIRQATEGDKVRIETNEALKKLAEELGDAAHGDPVLVAIFAAAGVAGFGDAASE